MTSFHVVPMQFTMHLNLRVGRVGILRLIFQTFDLTSLERTTFTKCYITLGRLYVSIR